MNDYSRAIIDAYIDASTRELFRSCGIEVFAAPEGAQGPESPFAATIGFTSGPIHGFLILALDRGLAERSLPASLRGAAAEDEIVADWTGELSNQLLGRLKTRFARVGIDVELSTPVTFVGKDLRHFSNPSLLRTMLRFEESSGGPPFFVELQGDCPPGFEIGPELGSDEEGAEEGEVQLF